MAPEPLRIAQLVQQKVENLRLISTCEHESRLAIALKHGFLIRCSVLFGEGNGRIQCRCSNLLVK